MVDRWFPSSKTCSSCGNVLHSLSLLERVMKCEDCSFTCEARLEC
ncbi:zinc ribbon domain-containing protein [Okeania sp. KiyG1]